ncbi:hypothetical protein ROZALSC1DRAFT_2281, partial [Rozella allomycis CSF55]
GKIKDWDLFVPSTQMAMNLKISRSTKSRPYSLLFARPVNGFMSYQHSESEAPSESEIQKRLDYMTSMVYPTIQKLSENHILKEASKFNKSNKLTFFQQGAQVMVKDELRTSKSQPRYTGPFTILRRNQGGVYVLQGPDGSIYNRPPHALKLFRQPAINPGKSAEVGNILDYRLNNITNEDEYLVKWKNQTHSCNSWVSIKDFDNHQPIHLYWKRLHLDHNQ